MLSGNTHPTTKIRKKRKFVPAQLEVVSWESIADLFEDLITRDLSSADDLMNWLRDRSELSAVLEEDLAWRYIKMNCDTSNEDYAKSYENFVTHIQPQILLSSNKLDRKFYNSSEKKNLDHRTYEVFIRGLNTRIELFREENVPLFSQMQVEEQEYGKRISQMIISHHGKEMTLQQAANFIKNPNRKIREEVYRKIGARRLSDASAFQELLDSLLYKRQQIAKNAGFQNFLEYKWQDLGRFDYSIEDIGLFHEAIALEVCPLVNEIDESRRKSLGYAKLRPWDMDVDPSSKPALEPFKTDRELIEKSVQSFANIRPRFGSFIHQMDEGGFLDLDSRIGKAPGGFNYPLYESNIPFIFMNATGNLRDLETMFHEGGHAIHSFLSSELELVDFKELPAEVAELASMSMELISMDQWHLYFSSEADFNRARRSQLEGILKVLPWIAAVDKFQQWLYINPGHSVNQRNNTWESIIDQFGSPLIDWSGFEDHKRYMWQKQLHIYEVPLYYIEYGIAQLGAIALWKHYKQDPVPTLDKYEEALSMGYSRPIPEIYERAGLPFKFTRSYVRELMIFVKDELDRLDT